MEFKCFEKNRTNRIERCLFDGVETQDHFLIATSSGGKPISEIIIVKDCIFRNCSTERASEKIIRQYVKYTDNQNKTRDFQAIKTINCSGLDMINKNETETENISVRTISTTGNSIGSSIEFEAQ